MSRVEQLEYRIECLEKELDYIRQVINNTDSRLIKPTALRLSLERRGLGGDA